MNRSSGGPRVRRLTLDNLAELPFACTSCLFWEYEPVHRRALKGHEREEKSAWLSRVLREWGSCGAVAYADDRPVGFLVWAPAIYVPGAEGFATAPISPDAVLLSTGYVDPEHRRGGLGRVLVQSMAKDVLKHGGVRAVEAFGDTRGRAGDCTLPADFLLAVGFKTQRAHPTYPRMRMDLRTTLTWREEFETALAKLRGAVGAKASAPRPVHRDQAAGPR